jgi:hypothetical protein
MNKDASAIFRAENGALERLSALETLKGLKNRDAVTLGDLVRYLESRGLWAQFGKITLGDLREGFGAPEPSANDEGVKPKKRKQRILEDELADIEVSPTAKEAAPEDGGLSTDEVARQVLPFVEGNGDVTMEDIAEYTRIDRKVLRFHLAALVKQGRLERIGVGRHAVYATL